MVVDKPPPKRRLFEVFPGSPTPFGATLRDGGVNFSVYSSNATSIFLCLIRLLDLPEVELLIVKLILVGSIIDLRKMNNDYVYWVELCGRYSDAEQ